MTDRAIRAPLAEDGESRTYVVKAWRVKLGDFVEEGDPVCDLSFEGGVVTVASPARGEIKDIVRSEGQQADAAYTIGVIKLDAAKRISVEGGEALSVKEKSSKAPHALNLHLNGGWRQKLAIILVAGVAVGAVKSVYNHFTEPSFEDLLGREMRAELERREGSSGGNMTLLQFLERPASDGGQTPSVFQMLGIGHGNGEESDEAQATHPRPVTRSDVVALSDEIWGENREVDQGQRHGSTNNVIELSHLKQFGWDYIGEEVTVTAIITRLYACEMPRNIGFVCLQGRSAINGEVFSIGLFDEGITVGVNRRAATNELLSLLVRKCATLTGVVVPLQSNSWGVLTETPGLRVTHVETTTNDNCNS